MGNAESLHTHTQFNIAWLKDPSTNDTFRHTMQLSLKAPVARAPVAAAGARRPRVMICRSGTHPSMKVCRALSGISTQFSSVSHLSCVAHGESCLRFQDLRRSMNVPVRSFSGAMHPGWATAPVLTLVSLVQDVEEIGNKVADAIKEAEETCKGGDASHCAAA